MGQGLLSVKGVSGVGGCCHRAVPLLCCCVSLLSSKPSSSPGFPILSPFPERKSPKLSGGHWTNCFKLCIPPYHLLILSECLQRRTQSTPAPPPPSLGERRLEAPLLSPSLPAGNLLLESTPPPSRILTSLSGRAWNPLPHSHPLPKGQH